MPYTGRDDFELRHPRELFIGGRWVAAPQHRRLTLVSPIDGKPFGTYGEAGPEDVASAVAAARVAFDRGPWPRMAPSDRANILREAAAAFRRKADAAAAAWTTQIGVPLWLATAITIQVLDTFAYYASLIEQHTFEEERPTTVPGYRTAVVVQEPVGVVAAIAPWNAPLAQMLLKVAPALAAECVVIAKPAPESPIEALLLAEAFEEAGLPPGVFNLLPAGREVSELLVRHEGVDKVSFTGSSTVGAHLAQICAARMARVTMELGGKSAALILEDMDPGEVAESLASIVTTMSGQVCTNLTRVLVPKRKSRAYIEALGAALVATKVGDPFEDGVMMGPLAMERQLKKVESYIAIGQSEGAALVTGGGQPAGLDQGFYFAPTLFSDVSNDMRIAQEEIFGPVAVVIAYDGEDEAIELANKTKFGLAGGVFTKDPERAYAIARRMRAGSITHNGRAIDLSVPFGGFKHSGIGRECGPEGLTAYLETKSIFLQ